MASRTSAASTVKGRPALRSVEERNALVEANLGLVPWAVQRFTPTDDEHVFQDRKAAGYLGLIRAAELFDEDRGIAFSTYAVHWIRQAVQRDSEFGSTSPAIHVPPGTRFEPVRVVASLDAPRHSDDDSRTLADLLPAPEDAQDEDVAWVRELLAALPELERRVVVARHSITSSRLPLAWNTVARVTGLRHEEAQEVYERALARLRLLASDGLEEAQQLPEVELKPPKLPKPSKPRGKRAGHPMSAETRAKISAALTGKRKSPRRTTQQP